MKRQWVRKATLRRYYNRFKNSPERIFICRDFGSNSLDQREVLRLLVFLDVIEEVEVIFEYGVNYKGRRKTIGYRLKNVKERLKEEQNGKLKTSLSPSRRLIK